DINDNLTIVGNSRRSGGTKVFPFMWTSVGGMVDLMTGYTDYDAWGSASAVNNSNVVVGSWAPNNAQPQVRAFVYQSGTISTLTATGLDSIGASPVKINDAGVVAGQWGVVGPPNGTFVVSGGAAASIGSIGGVQSSITGQNILGTVVGSSQTTGDTAVHACVWVPDTWQGLIGTIKDLGTLG